MKGADALDRARLIARVGDALLPLGRQWGAIGPIWQALSALDVALWNLQAQVDDTPIGSLLSSQPATHVPVYASGVGPDNVTLLLDRSLEQGFGAAKLKIGFGRDADEAILTQARATVGDSFTLFADANRAWNLDQAIEMTHLLAGFGVEWCEEPLERDTPQAFGELFEQGGLPLTLGENSYGLRLAQEYIAVPGIHHFQPDLSKTGGITMLRDYGALTAGTVCRLTPHSYGSALSVVATAQCAASLDHLGWVELDVRDNPFRTDIVREPFGVHGGLLEVPQVTSLADAIDFDVLGRFEVQIT